MARTITIQIIDADSGNNLEDVAVAVKKNADDAELSSGVTDVNGEYTSDAQTAATEYYLTASKTGYIPYVKHGSGAGENFEMKLHWDSPTADETQEIQILMMPERSRTQIVVTEGAGATSGAAQAPVSGATVLVKKTSDNTLLETLTTDSNGVAIMDESAYGAVAHYAVVSKTGYNSHTVYGPSFVKGGTISVTLEQSVSFTTYEFAGRLIDAEGNPIVGKTLKLEVAGMHSITDSGVEYYVATGEVISLTSDENGKFSKDIVSGLRVRPKTGWTSYFGYPEKVEWTISADIDLGDGTAGSI